jgi:uncharacterized protein YdeI (BOF family)
LRKNILPAVIAIVIGGAVLIGLMSIDNVQSDEIKKFDSDIEKAKTETSLQCGDVALRVVTPGSSIHENPVTILFGQIMRDDMDYHFIFHNKTNRLEVITTPRNQPNGQQTVVAEKNLPSSEYCINQLAH